MATQRSGLVILLALVVLAGLAARTMIMEPASPVESATDTARLETAQAFYDAWNAVLGGAPIDALGALLSPLFVDHSSETGTTQSGDAFLEEVSAMQPSSSKASLEVLAIEAAGGNVTASIRHVPGGPVAVAGLTVEQSTPAPHIEVLRIERGKIVDRWAAGPPWLRVFESAETVSISHFSGIDAMLTRLKLTGSTEHAWRMVGLGMMIVESGSARLQMAYATTVRAPVVVERGSVTTIPYGARVRVRSADGQPTSVLIYAAMRVRPVEPAATADTPEGSAPGGSQTVLWNGLLTWSQSPTDHRAAQIVLPVGGTVEIARPPDTELLVGVDTGAMEAGIPGGSVTMLGEDRWPVNIEGLVQADASHAVLVSDQGTVIVRNLAETPVTLTLISVQGEPLPGKTKEHSNCPLDSDHKARAPCFIE